MIRLRSMPLYDQAAAATTTFRENTLLLRTRRILMRLCAVDRSVRDRAVAFVAVTLLISANRFAVAQSDAAEPDEIVAEASITDLAAVIKKSLVMVHATGRDGKDYGHGTGFVISADGLIATCRHVIGDNRPIRIDMPDGRSLPVTHIHSFTEAVDVVILRVDAVDLTPLRLGDESLVQDGQSVVAVGHPGSMKNSVFSGIVSGRKEIAEISMLQLSMTIEPGSSGEPVVDRQGNVLGVVALKSTETTNVGFAVPVSHLKGLLADPTSIPMSRWMTIGALDPNRWTTLFGANWRQRASRILVNGSGDGFGGRSLCLQTIEPPPIPFEVQVDVKLAEDAGAAGLVFHADGKDRHYGFYPSNGKVRLTRFDGPTVYQWTVLHNEPHPAYRADEWNTWRVRIEADRMLCFLNGQQVLESKDAIIPPGAVGVATYRGTAAEFRRFRVAAELPSDLPTRAESAEIRRIVAEIPHHRPAPTEMVAALEPHRQYVGNFLESEARRMEARAQQLRKLATNVHASNIRDRVVAALKPSDETSTPDLLLAALLIAVLDNPEIEPETYVERVGQLASEVRESVQQGATESERLAALDTLLFQEYGFRGSRDEYYTRSNSYLNEVIDDREGLPITLAVLYMELARRLDLNVVGVGLPGHFVVRFEPAGADEAAELIDVFNRGQRLSVKQAEQIVKDRRLPLRPEFFEASSAQQIVVRMLVNLLALAEAKRDDERVLRYLETLVAIDDGPEYRAKRLEIRARTGRLAEAVADADWFIREQPEGTDNDRLFELRAELQRQLDRQEELDVR